MDDEELAAVAADELRRRVLVALEFLGDAYYVRPAHRAVIELVRRAEEAVTLRTERDRLARILAVERWDEGQAPEGWVWVKAGFWRRGLEGAIERRANSLWEWSAWVDSICTPSLVGLADTALEAMEAADKARGAHHD